MFKKFFNKAARENRRKRRDQYSLDVKVRSAQRVQAQIGTGILWLAMALSVLLVAAGAYRMFQFMVAKSFTDNAAYSITAIEVKSDGSLAREDILELAGVREGQNLFALDLAGIRRALETHPVVRRAEIRRELPGKLYVTVSERVPIAQIYTRALRDAAGRVLAPPTSFLIDVDAVVMKSGNPFATSIANGKTPARLPLLTGVELIQAKLGHRIESEQVQKGLDLVHLCETSDFGPLLDYDRIDVVTEGYLVMVTRLGGTITFATENLAVQLKRLRVILTHPSRASQTIRTCDLSAGINVPVTYFAPVSAVVGDASLMKVRTVQGGKIQ